MLQMEYVNSFNRNYLKLIAKAEEGSRPRYQQQIISTKKLEGLLPVMLYATNGENGFYYDISSMQGLDKWFIKEKISEKWVDKLMSGLQTALWSLKEYLLDSRNLIMRRDCIFVNMESEKIFFLYYPYYTEQEKSNMEDLMSFLIENAEEKEPDTAGFLYNLFSKWDRIQEDFKPEDMVSLWVNHKREKEKKDELEENEEKISACPKPEDEKPEIIVERKKDLSEFIFGRHKKIKTEGCQKHIAAEAWEYKADKQQDTENGTKEADEMTQTVYMEISPETEERKLYGSGRENRKVISLDKLPLVIGKKEKVADVVLQNASISRMHARITEENGRIYLEDLNATNGTFQNGVRLKPYEKVEILKEDEIKLGKLMFTYR